MKLLLIALLLSACASEPVCVVLDETGVIGILDGPCPEFEEPVRRVEA